MTQRIQVVAFDGALLCRGFWLYVWQIKTPQNGQLFYIGRTGDSSSQNAQSPFNRMSQHLGFNKRNNVLRRRLKTLGIEPSNCSFRLVAYGPIMKEASTREGHRSSRDRVAAMEKALADVLVAAGNTVLNPVSCHKRLDEDAFAIVCSAFGEYFPELQNHILTGSKGGPGAMA